MPESELRARAARVKKKAPRICAAPRGKTPTTGIKSNQSSII